MVGGGGPIFPLLETKLHVFDGATGELRASCAPDGPAVFVNDVTAIDGTAYVTDSLVNSIMTVDVEAALNGTCVTSSIALPEDPFLSVPVEDFAVQGNGT